MRSSGWGGIFLPVDLGAILGLDAGPLICRQKVLGADTYRGR
jgi:hypothetical protein